MKRISLNQSGFEAAAIVVVVLVLAVIGFGSYKFLATKKAAPAAATPQASSQVTVPDTIQSKSDLTNTGKSLDNSSSQVDNTLNDGSLDSDLNAML